MAADIVEIKNARIIYKNFAGRADKYNEKGKRNFALVLNQAQADDLANKGFNVKSRPPRDAQDDTLYYIKVNVQFDTAGRPPRVVMVEDVQTKLSEDMVDLLDDMYIDYVNIRFRGYEYDPGKQSAFLQTLYAAVKTDDLASEFSDVPLSGTKVVNGDFDD